jgi:hypothetical protein
MKIHSLSKVLILPCAIAAIAIIYYAETTGNRDMTVWVFIPAVLLTIVLIFMPQIDYWWHTKYPLPLDPEVVKWLSTYSPFYRKLSEEDKKRFEYRLGLYMEGREFKSVGTEIREVPEDMKGIIGSIAVMLTLNQENFLIGEYNRVYLYKHPFPTPEHQYLHSVEVNHEDGLIIFSMEQLVAGITRPQDIYPIGLHAYIEALYNNLPSMPLREQHITWEDIENTGKYRKEHIIAVTGLEDIDLNIVAAVNAWVFPEIMEKKAPGLFKKIKSIFT